MAGLGVVVVSIGDSVLSSDLLSSSVGELNENEGTNSAALTFNVENFADGSDEFSLFGDKSAWVSHESGVTVLDILS